MVFSVVVAGDAPPDYAKRIVGCWLGERKLDLYHADGTWGFKRNEDAPEELAGQWRVQRNKLIITGSTDHGVASAEYTIISCTDHTLVLEINGDRKEYRRYSADCRQKA
jgi:hypothetical protein